MRILLSILLSLILASSAKAAGTVTFFYDAASGYNVASIVGTTDEDTVYVWGDDIMIIININGTDYSQTFTNGKPLKIQAQLFDGYNLLVYIDSSDPALHQPKFVYEGGDNDDYVWTGKKSDSINTKGGDDTVNSFDSVDTILVGTGDDTVYSGASPDIVIDGGGTHDYLDQGGGTTGDTRYGLWETIVNPSVVY